MSLDERFDDVLSAAQAGEEWALGALYEDLQPRLLRYLRVHEPRVTEDLAHDVWLGVALGIRRVSGGEDDLRARVFTIARRRLLDLRRSDARRRTFPMEARRLVPWGPVATLREEALELLGTALALSRIAMLPPSQADVVLLRVLGGLSVGEVARIIGKRSGAVRGLQHRALRRLASIVAREQGTEMGRPRDTEGEMADPRLRLDAGTADRLLGGRVAPDDAPPGYAKVAGMLGTLAADLPSRPPAAGESTIRMMARVVRISDPVTSRRRPHPLRGRIVALAMVCSLGTTGVAFAAGLPDAADGLLSTWSARIGVMTPHPRDRAGPSHAEPSGADPHAPKMQARVTDPDARWTIAIRADREDHRPERPTRRSFSGARSSR